MKGKERREKILALLSKSSTAISGKELGNLLGVSRQVIVQDIALLRAEKYDIVSTNNGYILLNEKNVSRVFKVIHSDDQVEDELQLIVDYGGVVEDVFVYHKIYGTVRAEMNIHSRNDIANFLSDIKSGKSSLLKNVTSGYHYHTVSAPTEAILNLIQEKLNERGYLAKLQDYEPIDFWKEDN